SYGLGLLIFHVFCDSKSIPEDQIECAPASCFLISSFITEMAGSKDSVYGVHALPPILLVS
ncbi:hypothetical protein P692DRAFT_20761085, partial [Suillus brevipes Sb2]